MREVAFLRQNSEKWKEFDELLKNTQQSADPNRLTDLFVELTDDLSYAKTFYPQSKSTQYLNALSAKVHQKLYRNKKEKASRLLTFWKEEIPRELRAAHRYLLISFSVFLIAFFIGALSVHYDQRFARLILGDGYVNMTEENIKKGDPIAVYKDQDGWQMFLTIAINNELVAMRVFIGGVIFSLGTILILFYNGLMVGVFQFMFIEHGLFFSSARGIWVHGTLEISAIIIAGASGLLLGNSILFPGTFSRRESFSRGAQHAVKILIGLVPQILLAAALESYVTRYTNMPVWGSLLIIGSSVLFVVWYYVLYPLWLGRKAAE